MSEKCVFCHADATQFTIDGLPIYAECAKAASVLVGKNEKAEKTAKVMIETLTSKPK